MSAQKVALVTGSGKRRVGAHVAAALAARGYSLAVHYRTSAAEANETATVLASQFNIQAIPAFVLVIDGKEVDRVVGVTLESSLRRLLARMQKP